MLLCQRNTEGYVLYARPITVFKCLCDSVLPYLLTVLYEWKFHCNASTHIERSEDKESEAGMIFKRPDTNVSYSETAFVFRRDSYNK
jgi:hypothetical protein